MRKPHYGRPIFHLSSSAPPYKTERKKVKALVTCCTMLIALTTVWLVGLVVSYADARLPPKFLKATNNVGKIYAGRFGYSVLPVPPKFLVQSVARKEIHVPVLRPVRKKRRPLTGRRPGPPPALGEYGSNNYHDYAQSAGSKNHPRLRKAPKYRRKPRPPPREPDYYEQEIEDEPEDFGEYDYDDRHHDKPLKGYEDRHHDKPLKGYEDRHHDKPPKGYEDRHHDKPLKGYEERPSKRGHSSGSTKAHDDGRPKGPTFKGDRHKTRFEEEDEFIAQHSELYSSGYPHGKVKSRPPRFREHDDIEHHFGPPSGRKPNPSSKGYKGPSRPSSKLYSAAVPPPRRPTHYPKDEDRYRYEEEEEEEVSHRPRYKKRPRVPEEEVYDDTSQYKDSDKDVEQEKETGYSRPGGVIHEEYHYSPDNFYHDRKFEPKQKSKRGTEDKESDPGSKLRSRRPENVDEDHKTFHPNEQREEDDRGGEKKGPPRRKKENPRFQQEESQQQQEHRAPPNGKWSVPFTVEPEDEDVWGQGKAKASERPPWKQPETAHELPMPPRPKKVEEKPVSEYETAQSSWPVIVQGLNWKDAPHPFAEHHSPQLFNNWQNFQIPQWPNMDEQLGKFPESLRSTFKWVEPTNQTPRHSTPAPPNFKTTTSLPAIAIPPVDYSARGIGSQNEPRRKKSSKRSKNRPNGETEVVAQRIVGGTLQLNGGFKQEPSKDEWANPAFLSASNTPGRSPEQQYTVEMFKSVEPVKPFEGEIVYGTRITDSKPKNIEPDIGYHSGMETIDDDIGGWQVY